MTLYIIFNSIFGILIESIVMILFLFRCKNVFECILVLMLTRDRHRAGRPGQGRATRSGQGDQGRTGRSGQGRATRAG